MADPSEIWAEFEREGEPEVQRKYDMGLYGPTKKPHAAAFLEQKRREREKKSVATGEAQQETIVASQVSYTRATWWLVAATLLLALVAVLLKYC